MTIAWNWGTVVLQQIKSSSENPRQERNEHEQRSLTDGFGLFTGVLCRSSDGWVSTQPTLCDRDCRSVLCMTLYSDTTTNSVLKAPQSKSVLFSALKASYAETNVTVHHHHHHHQFYFLSPHHLHSGMQTFSICLLGKGGGNTVKNQLVTGSRRKTQPACEFKGCWLDSWPPTRLTYRTHWFKEKIWENGQIQRGKPSCLLTEPPCTVVLQYGSKACAYSIHF